MSITSKLAILEQCKTAIKNAITAKGGTVTATSGFSTFADEIAGIPSGEDIGALIDRSITELTVPNGVTSIGSYAMYGCNLLHTVTIPDSVTSIGGSVFNGDTSLQNIRFSKAITTIGSYAFRNCSSLQNIILPNSVTSMSTSVFDQCSAINNLVIPVGVSSIPVSAFTNDSSLNKIVLLKKNAIVSIANTNAFSGTPFASGGAGGTAYVPASLISAYQADAKWSGLNCSFSWLTETSETGDGSTSSFGVSGAPEKVFYVTVDGVTAYTSEDYTYDAVNAEITFSVAPANGAEIKVYC